LVQELTGLSPCGIHAASSSGDPRPSGEKTEESARYLIGHLNMVIAPMPGQRMVVFLRACGAALPRALRHHGVIRWGEVLSLAR
jgi:hypothetical protein